MRVFSKSSELGGKVDRGGVPAIVAQPPRLLVHLIGGRQDRGWLADGLRQAQRQVQVLLLVADAHRGPRQKLAWLQELVLHLHKTGFLPSSANKDLRESPRDANLITCIFHKSQ